MRPIKEIAENTITPKPDTVFVPAALWHKLLEAYSLGQIYNNMDEIVAHVITHNTILGNIDAIAANGTWNTNNYSQGCAK